MSKQYIAESLDDIATQFERFGADATKRASVMKSDRSSALLMRESLTWRAAAKVLRETELKAVSTDV